MNRLLLLPIAALMLGAAPPPAPSAPSALTLEAASAYLIDVEVNGRPLRLRVDPGASGSIILNPGAAAAAGLDGSMIGSIGIIGPVRIPGKTSATSLVIAGVRSRARLLWFERDIVAGADGLISPASLPFESVELRIAPPSPDERTHVLPVTFRRDRGLTHALPVGDKQVLIRLALEEGTTIATASSGAHIAAVHGGEWSGAAERRVLKLGVDRPVRPLRLQRPLVADGLTIDGFLVRTGDFRGKYALPKDAPADADEIVVTAAGKKSKALLWFTVGRDVIGRCSSIRYLRAASTLEVRCPA